MKRGRVATRERMSAVAALIILADAAAACAPPGAARLRAGAQIVLPVGSEPLPIQQLGPAAPMTREPKVQKVAATDEVRQAPEADAPPEQCKALPIPIV